MKYKALMLDIDGTIVPYDFNALPSKVVVDAIKKAQENVIVCLVTGREYGFIGPILKKLDLHKGFAVVNNGANVVDIKTKTLLYDQPMDVNEAKTIIDVLHEEKMLFHIKQDFDNREFIRKPFEKGDEFIKAYMFYVPEGFSEEKVDSVFKKIKHLSKINLFKTHHKDPLKFGMGITHVNATKLHGIEILMKQLTLKRDEIIGVGDSYNDFPLLMASGLKVAMGNAIPELKEIADYIAPTVADDGVADVIKKFIL